MKLGIMQPYFFPYIGYWQLINAVDKYVIYDDVNFIKGGWINRNKILMNNEGKMINLQMKGASSNKLINEVEVAGDMVYNKKLLKTIESCYKKAPHFDDVYPILKKIINNEERNLAKWLEYSIREISRYLCMNTEIIMSSSIKKNNNLKGQDKVIEICKLTNATEYYNAIGGMELYSYETFRKNEINLKFVKTQLIEYKQFNNEMIHNLSIIDVLMFNSVDKIGEMLDRFELIEENDK